MWWVRDERPDCTGGAGKAGQPSIRDQFVRLLGVDSSHLDAAVAACTALVRPRATYFEHLHRYDEREGLRLMALLHVLDVNSHGDLLRAAANALAQGWGN